MDNSEVFYHAAQAQAEEQDRRRQHFDTMAVGVLAASGAFTGVMAFSSPGWSKLSFIPAIGVLIFAILVAKSALDVLKIRQWSIQPRTDYLQEHFHEHDKKDLCLWSASEITRAIAENETPLSQKAQNLDDAYCWLMLQIGALGVLGVSSALRI